MNLEPIFIKATSLSDAWFQTLYRAVEASILRKFLKRL